MWNHSIAGANTGATFNSLLENASSIHKNNNSNGQQQHRPSSSSIDVERTNYSTTPVPAWFNWHQYQPQERFPNPKPSNSIKNNNENYNPHNSSLLGAASSSNINNKDVHTPRAGAPREVTSRTPIFERGGAFDPSSNTSLHHQMTPSSVRRTTTIPNERNTSEQQQQKERSLDQDQWMRRFGPQSPSSTLIDTRSNRSGGLTPKTAGQATTDLLDKYSSSNNNNNNNTRNHGPRSHVSFIEDENDAFGLATRLPGDRYARSSAAQKQRTREQQEKQPVLLEDSAPVLPWVPSSHSALAHQQMMKRMEMKVEQDKNISDAAKQQKLERGEKLFIVNVVTDPLRLGTVGSTYNQTFGETEHSPPHPKESGPRAFNNSRRGSNATSTNHNNRNDDDHHEENTHRGSTTTSQYPSRSISATQQQQQDNSSSTVKSFPGTNNNKNNVAGASSSSKSQTSAPNSNNNNNNNNNNRNRQFEKSSHVVLRNIKAKTVRGFAEAIETALALDHDIHLKFDEGFRFSNLMQTTAWTSVKSLVGDELLKESRVQQQYQRALNSTSRTALNEFFNSTAAAVNNNDDDDDDKDNDIGNNGTGGDRVLRAVSKAAAAAAGSISFFELPSELTVCPFPAKRRLAFHITCTTLHPAGVSVFPLREEEVILERRGSAWISDMDQLRQAISRVTHRDCSKAPLFLLNNASSEDKNEKRKHDNNNNNNNNNSSSSNKRQNSSPTKTTIKNHEIGQFGLPKCEPLVGPHQIPPFSSLLVTLDNATAITSTYSTNPSPSSSSSSSPFTLPDELGPASSFALGLPKRIKTPLAAAVIGDDDKMLMSFDNFVQTAKANGGSVPLKREEMLFSDEVDGHHRKLMNSPRTSRKEVDKFTDPRHRQHANAMNNTADEMMDEFRKKFNSDGSRKFNNDLSESNPSSSSANNNNSELEKELSRQPARANVNLIEHVISEGMARFGDYLEAGSIRVPKVFPTGSKSSAARRRNSSSGGGSNNNNNNEEDDAERSTTSSTTHDENDPERSVDSENIDEASRGLLFLSDTSTRPLRQYEVPKTRFRRALLQASMHLLRTAPDAEVLSTDALVRSTSDIVDIVLRELEQKYGYGTTRTFQLPLGTHEIDTIKRAAGRAVQLEIAVQVGMSSSSGGGGSPNNRRNNYNNNQSSVPFFSSNDPTSVARVNRERERMGLRPLANSAADHTSSPKNNNNTKNNNFYEMPVDSPGSRALTAANKAGDEKKQEEISAHLGLPSYEPLPDRKPLDGAVLVLTRPQFDLLTKRIVVFATCSVDIFSVQSAINAMRFHRHRSHGVVELQKTSEASYFRWCVAYGQHTAQSFHSYLKNKDAGSLEGTVKRIKEVPLDALVELGLARVDIVSFARPTTLALEISLRRPPTDQQLQLQQQQQNEDGSTTNNNENNNNNGTSSSSLMSENRDTTIDVLQADERYSVYIEVGDDEGGFVHQALTFILPTSVLHPEQYAEEQRRKSELRRGGKVIPQFEEM